MVFEDTCYWLSESKEDFKSAQDFCAINDGHIVIPNTPDKMIALTSLSLQLAIANRYVFARIGRPTCVGRLCFCQHPRSPRDFTQTI